jgi:hypothetical protein
MKDHSEFRFDFSELSLNPQMIEEVIGFNEGEDREFIQGMIDEIFSESVKIADVRAQYRVFNDISFDELNRTISIDKVEFDVKKIVFGQVKKADSLVLFLCTAGDEVGRQSRAAMQERDFLRGYIFDVMGSEIVEAAADIMQENIGREAEMDGIRITNRYSPGYCGWDVSEQHKLFSFFPDNHCGIKLTPSALMQPEKSVSGIIGLGEKVKMNEYTCRICDMKTCIYRRVKENRKN